MREKRFIRLNDVSAYKISFRLSNEVWQIVTRWDFFAKETIGKQFARAVDSVSANIAEGFGRRYKKDKIRFYYNSRGSSYEALDWLQKAKLRKVISQKEYKHILRISANCQKRLITW